MRNNAVNRVAWKEIPVYGRTLSSVITLPCDAVNDATSPAGSGPSLEYDFYSFNSISNSSNISATAYVSLSWNVGDCPLVFAAQLNGGAAQTQTFFPNPVPGGVPAAWNGPDGFVANSIISVVTPFTGVQAGKHTLKISAIEPAVVLQNIIITLVLD
ncbi:hypothetical protein DXG01_002845 [Tephrocybe rancida]|nr:hypothetical protein DXG01_002845 [Tephrocybe rancida]